MAANLTKIIKGIQMYDRDGSAVTVDAFPIDVDPSAGGGVAANAGSLALRDVAGAGTSGELWVKTGAADTAWTKLDTGGGSAIEEGFLRAFVGKSGTGSELPTYTSTNVVTASANLEVAIGEIDTEIGAGVSATGRTQNDVSDQAINLNIAALSSAIGADADMPATLNYIALASTVYANLKSLDTQSKAVQDAVDALETGQKWIEAMVVVTATDLSAQSGLAVTWSDDDGGAPTLLAGDRVYSTADDTIYVAAAGAWGAGTAAVAGETFFSGVNLLDPVNQEKGAGFTYNGAATVKVADFDFELATTINLSGSYTAANGTVVASESVESALQKLAGNQIDLTTLSGESQGAVDHGTFTGTTIADNRDTHEALQDLETALEAAGASGVLTNSGVGGAFVTIDTVAVADADFVIWHTVAEGVTDDTKRYAATLRGLQEGTPALADSDESPFLEDPANPLDVTYQVIVSGTDILLQVKVDETGGGNIKTVRALAL